MPLNLFLIRFMRSNLIRSRRPHAVNRLADFANISCKLRNSSLESSLWTHQRSDTIQRSSPTTVKLLSGSGRNKIACCSTCCWKNSAIRRSLEHVFPRYKRTVAEAMHPPGRPPFWHNVPSFVNLDCQRGNGWKSRTTLVTKKKTINYNFFAHCFPGKENSHSPDFCFYLRSSS